MAQQEQQPSWASVTLTAPHVLIIDRDGDGSYELMHIHAKYLKKLEQAQSVKMREYYQYAIASMRALIAKVVVPVEVTLTLGCGEGE